MMRRQTWIVFPLTALVVTLVSTLATSPAHATQVRALDLQQLTDQAGTIFYGRCVHVEETHDAATGLPILEATFAVDRAVKGDVSRTHVIRMLRSEQAGAPSFRPGEQVVLFLYAESTLGLSSPVGFGQGKFTVSPDKSGRPVAIHAFRSEVLERDLARRLDGSDATSPPGIEPHRLLDLIETLQRPAGNSQ